MSYAQRPRQKSILETYIERACDPRYNGPDLALNLEICSVINEKQKNTPREAAIYIVRLVNHKNMYVGMLALALLDHCVKNCGYPFHLQIASKEFLNALVRKFPERPLTVPTPIQNRILEMIQEWYTTLCKTSRYKEDLVHIRDMHRLLSFKGYRFPKTKKTSAAVLNPIESLKTPEELEEEDRVAHSARLQELIRRGRPEDVRAANELVKKMTGFEQDEKPDYVEQASATINKIMQKAILLNEMLNDVKPGEIIGRGDIFEELFGNCKAVYPKVQDIISKDKDPDNIDSLLRLNEILTIVIDQYEKVKSGEITNVALPENSGDNNTQSNGDNEQAPSTPKQKQQSSLIDLLDFGGSSPEESPSAATTPKTTGNLMDDLMNLNFNDAPPPSWGTAGGISLGSSNSIASRSPTSPSPFSNNTGGATVLDPFSSTVASPSSFSTPSFTPTSPLTPTFQVSSKKPSPLDDFDFVSNTEAPTQVVGPESVVLLNKNGVQIDLEIEKQSQTQSNFDLPLVATTPTYKIRAYFSNHQNSPITSLTFRVAVPKTLQLKLEPQSAQVIPPFSKRSVTQDMTIRAVAATMPSAIRMRYHVSYNLSGRTIEEQGEFSQFH